MAVAVPLPEGTEGAGGALEDDGLGGDAGLDGGGEAEGEGDGALEDGGALDEGGGAAVTGVGATVVDVGVDGFPVVADGAGAAVVAPEVLAGLVLLAGAVETGFVAGVVAGVVVWLGAAVLALLLVLALAAPLHPRATEMSPRTARPTRRSSIRFSRVSPRSKRSTVHAGSARGSRTGPLKEMREGGPGCTDPRMRLVAAGPRNPGDQTLRAARCKRGLDLPLSGRGETMRRTMMVALALAAGVLAAGEPVPAADERPGLFEDVSEKAGFKGLDGHAGVYFVDLDEDGRPDAIIGDRFFLNKGDGRFTPFEVPADLGPTVEHNFIFGDVNNDGHLDCFVFFLLDAASKDWKDPGRRNELWLGDGKGGFKKKTDTGLSTKPQTTAAPLFFDYDGDGNLDLFVGNWWDKPWQTADAMLSPLYKGRGDGTFEDVTAKAGLLLAAEPGKRNSRKPLFCATHTDWNNDGLQDLLLGTYAGHWNSLFRNNGDGTFTDVGQETGFDCDTASRIFCYGSPDHPACNLFTFSCPVADYDCDGNMDCFQATIRHWDNRLTDPSMILRNLGKEKGFKFQRDLAQLPRRAELMTNWGDCHAAWVDVDNDGWEDLLVASSEYPDEQTLKLYHQIPDGSGRFEDWTDRLGFRWVSAANISLADFDRDGATDILVANSHMRFSPEQQKQHPLTTGLFRNLEPKRLGNGFFNVRLSGQSIGARVTIWTGDHRQIREVYGAIGIGGQRNDSDCRFGIGKATVIDRVEVRWPDRPNTVQVFKGVSPNRFYRLEKGGALEEDKRWL